ncbi:uncharacterized protein N0V89_003217 [Didymosphaeria variabile]|uniref:Zinc-binding loop region of homing endonuclease domain-containing protein n=1 Tax=Didymosphaeria variabile TaxID=1932322 RepID=A0A9W8XUY9_9PLEO|nr:uncharacterized protein N0V89_003217 [Didymosphaeria variabile]KAJ4358633.1 hypothetical protein N0V89_003217 [Didymosphaeria variabile]
MLAPLQVNKEDEQARQSSNRKRYFSDLLGLAREARPAKQRKEGNVRSSKDEASDRPLIPSKDDEDLIEPPGTGIQGDLSNSLEIEISGSGTRDDPLRFPTWEGNVISNDYHGECIELSDDEDEDVVNTNSSASFLNVSKPSGSHLIHTEGAEGSGHGGTSSARTHPFPGSEGLASSIDTRSVDHTPLSRRMSSSLLYGFSFLMSPIPKLMNPRSPPSPSPAHTHAFTKPTSTAPISLSETTVRRPSWLVHNPDSLVKIEQHDLEDSDDEFFDEQLSVNATSLKGRARDACCGSVSTATRTNVPREQQAQEEDLFFVADMPNQSEDAECDCVIVLERVKPANLSRQPWTIDFKKEREEVNDVPDTILSQQTSASEVQQQPDPSDDLFYTARSASTICSASETTVTDVISPFVPRAPVEFSESIDWDVPLPVSTRKRLFFDTYHHLSRARLENVLRIYYSGTQGGLSPNRCRLYTGRRLPKPPSQTLRISIEFQHNSRVERLSLNILVVKMLLDGSLSKEHIDGIVNNSWHASHLCGNWTCLNTKHVVPEPGSVNNNRNVCFRDVHGPCNHTPKCMKHLKLDKHLLRPGTGMTALKNFLAA